MVRVHFETAFFWLCFIDTYIPYFSTIPLKYLKKEASFLFQMASLNVSLTKKRRVSCRGQLQSAQFVYCVGEKSALLYCQDMLRYMKTQSKSTIEIVRKILTQHFKLNIFDDKRLAKFQVLSLLFVYPCRFSYPIHHISHFHAAQSFRVFSISSPRPPF